LFDRLLGDRVETNIRIVAGPETGGLNVHRLTVRSGRQHADLRQAVCSALRRKHDVVAVPSPQDANELWSVSPLPQNQLRLSGAKYDADVSQTGAQLNLSFSDRVHLHAMEDLVERSITLEFERSRKFWRTNKSARIWYSDEVVQSRGDIEALQRVSFSGVILPGERIGVAIESGYLYRMRHSVADVFDPSLPAQVASARRERFDRLRGKRNGRSGSLLYDTNGSAVHTCFFDRAAPGVRCDATGPIMGQKSLHHYVRSKYRNMRSDPGDPVAYVSFDNLPNVAVPAKALRLRLSTEKNTLSNDMRRATSLSPARRRELTGSAWKDQCKAAMRRLGFKVDGPLWVPAKSERDLIGGPTLVFGKDRKIMPPTSPSLDEYRRYYRERLRILRTGGVLRLEPSVERRFAIVTPVGGDELHKRFVDDFANVVQAFTGVGFKVVTLRASEVDDIVAQVQGSGVGAAVIVFDSRAHDDASYFILSHELGEVRIKRLTRQVVESKYAALMQSRGEEDRKTAENEWRSMVELSAIKFLDQFAATPWGVESFGYDAIVSIDVGQNRRHWALSLLASIPGSWHPLRVTIPFHKGDVHKEEVNPEILFDKLMKLFGQYVQGKLPPLHSLLVLRDGKFCGTDGTSMPREEAAIRRAIDLWLQRGWIAQGALVDLVEVHKTSMKGFRLWYDDRDGVGNVLEGEAVYLDEEIILCCTGAGTLSRNVTAAPSVLKCQAGADKRRVAQAYFAAAQLNYHNPSKAHRLAQPLRETDAELRHRVAMDMRGIR
jgi:hypothetical protein